MDLPLSIPLQPVVIERSGVQNSGVPVLDRAPLKYGWRVLANKEKFMAVIPNAQRKQHTPVDNWFQLLNALDPDPDEERYWDTNIVERHGMHIFDISQGQDKTDNVLAVADTLLEKTMQFASAICRFGRDPQTRLKAGSKLVYGDFMQKLLGQTYTIVTVNKLQRHLNKKIYFGREEFQLMVEQVLADTIHCGRQVALQKLAVVGLAFIIDLRPVSIGPFQKLYEEHEKYPKIKRRQRGLEATIEELEPARESFQKPSKILRTSGPVASSSALQLGDTAGPVASSSTHPHDDSSSNQLPSDPQIDDGQEEDYEESRKNIQRMYSFARLRHGRAR